MAMQVHCGTYLAPTHCPLRWVVKQSPSAESAWMDLLLARRTQPAALSEHYFYIGISLPSIKVNLLSFSLSELQLPRSVINYAPFHPLHSFVRTKVHIHSKRNRWGA